MNRFLSLHPRIEKCLFFWPPSLLWRRLTEPHPFILEPERRQRARLLSALLFIIILTIIAGFPLSFLFHYSKIGELVILAGSCLIVLLYGISRTKHYNVSAVLSVITILFTILSLTIVEQNPEILAYLILCMMMCGLFLSPRLTILFVAVSILSILAIPIFDRYIPFKETLGHEVFLISLMGIMSTVLAAVQAMDVKHIEQQSQKLAADLVELRRGKEALEQSEARLQLWIERMPVACIVWDDTYRISAWNPAAERIFGFPEREALGRQPYKFLIMQKERKHIDEIFERLLLGDTSADSVNENLTKDGRIILCEWSNSPLRGPDGKVTGVLSMVQDITARRYAEEALRTSEERYRTLFNRIPAALYRTSEAGQFLDVNPALVSLLGYPDRETLLATNVNDLFIDPRERLTEHSLMEQDGVLRSYQVQVYRYDRKPIWIRDTSMIVRSSGQGVDGAQGDTFYYEGSIEDVTERKLAEDNLRGKTEELEALFSISSHLRQAQTVEDMLQLVLVEVNRVLVADASVVILLEPGNKNFRIALANGVLEKNTGWKFPVNQGISGEIFRTHQPQVTQDYALSALKLPDLPGNELLGPAVFVPLQSESQFLGVLLATRLRGAQAEPFSPTSVRLLTTMGEMVGTALRRLRLFDDARRRLSEVQALREIDMAIIDSTDLRISVRAILNQVRSLMGVDAASLLVLNSHMLLLEYMEGQGFRTQAIEDTCVRLGEGYAGRAALERKTLHISDLRSRKTDILRSPIFWEEGFISYFAVPLLAKGQVKGVLEIFHRSLFEADAEWVQFLETLAGQAAIAIDNAGMFADLQHSNQELILAYNATIEGWSRALDLRDKETEGHTQRVTEMTVRLARSMGMNESELIHVRRGALLHDIGKMGIPDHILLKPGTLTPEEWVVMHQHPIYAYEMLAPIRYLRQALDIPYCHHEKWDGSGYPRGLQGEAIPLVARIFAVVDVWDALTSNRTYRPAWTHEKALAYIAEQSGKHFDPQVVDIFLTFIQSGAKL